MTFLAYVVTSYGQRMQLLQILRMLKLAKKKELFEVIVVDDKPADGQVAAIARDWSKLECASMSIVSHVENAGAAAARNTGAALANADWVTFVDGDDFVLPWHAESMFELLDGASAEVGACAEVYWRHAESMTDDQVDGLRYAKRARGDTRTPDYVEAAAYPWPGGGLVVDGKLAWTSANVLHGGAHRRVGLPKHSNLFWRWLGTGAEDIDFSLRSLARGECRTTSQVNCCYRYLTAAAGTRGRPRGYKSNVSVERALVDVRMRTLFPESTHGGLWEKLKLESAEGFDLQKKIESGELDESPMTEFKVEYSR